MGKLSKDMLATVEPEQLVELQRILQQKLLEIDEALGA